MTTMLNSLNKTQRRRYGIHALLATLLTAGAGCKTTSLSAPKAGSDLALAAPTFTVADLKAIYFKFYEDPANADAPIPPWPRLNPVTGVQLTDAAITQTVLSFVGQDPVCQMLRKAAQSRQVKVSFVGVSAARFVYRAVLKLQRAAGYQQITPQATRGDFDNLFPLYNSEVELFVEGAPQAVQAFEEDLSELRKFVLLTIDTPDASGGPPRGLDSASSTLLPLEGDWTVPPQLAADLQSGVLNGDLSKSDEYRVDTLKALNAIALFNLQPSSTLFSQLKANLLDVSAYNYAEVISQIKLPNVFNFLERYAKSQWGNRALNFQITKLYSQMYAEAADLEAFAAAMKNLNYFFALVTPDEQFDPMFTQRARFYTPLPTPAQPLQIYDKSSNDRYKSTTLADLATTPIELHNHADLNWDSYRRFTLNPYGKVNGPISDGSMFTGKMAHYGPGLYALPGWDRSYYDGGYNVLIVQAPSVGIAESSIKRSRAIIDYSHYVVLQHSAESYVYEPPYVVDGLTLFKSLMSYDRPYNRVLSCVNHERRMLIDLSFNPEYSDQRFALEQWFDAIKGKRDAVSNTSRANMLRFRLAQLTADQQASYAAWLKLNPFTPPRFEPEALEGSDQGQSNDDNAESDPSAAPGEASKSGEAPDTASSEETTDAGAGGRGADASNSSRGR